MTVLGQQLTGKNIMSLRVGRPVGVTTGAIINPNNLKIEGWFANESDSKKRMILLSQEIRDIIPEGFVVNDHEALTNPEDLIRLKKVLEYKFELIGKPVVSNHRRKIGKVTDYAFDKDSFMIQKLHIEQTIIKSFMGGALMIDRAQIVEINDKKIIIKEATAEDTSPMPAMA